VELGFWALSGESLNFLIGLVKRIEIFQAGLSSLLDAGSVSQMSYFGAERLIQSRMVS
jgi:hypothetical protein